jgi:ketosteroid isomerase-like protein
MLTTDPKAVVTRYVEAVIAGDIDVIRESFAQDATWTYPGDVPVLSGTWTGRDTIVDDFLGAAAGRLFVPGSVTIELTWIIAEGDRVVAEWTSKAQAATGGGTYDNRNVGVFTVRDGRITAVQEFTDTLHAATVLFPERTPDAAA